MNRLPTTFRIVLGLVSITASILFFSHPIGLFPDSRNLITQGRAQLCESLAIQFSLLATKGDLTTMEACLRAVANRNPEIESMAIRYTSGELLLEIGNHKELWIEPETGLSHDGQMFVSIASHDEPWGTVEICFHPTHSSGWYGILEEPLVRVVIFVVSMCALFYYAFLHRLFVQLNPSAAVPSRVRSALDTLTQGLVILDLRHRIVLANRPFCQLLGKTPESLLGKDLDRLPWQSTNGEPLIESSHTPWSVALRNNTPLTGIVMDLRVSPDLIRIFVVNAAPVLTDRGQCRGALISLEDITSLETTKRQLRDAMERLNVSHEAIRLQNVELERLATTDPLTGCMNRRSFFSRFEPAWKEAEKTGLPISCIMVDIDHFKSVNDTRGHATGDEVLKAVASILRTMAREGDVVSRFGGEEFCILLPNTTLDQASQVAEQFRRKIASETIEGLSITASFGVSERSLGALEPSQLLDQADQCLYVAKESGRNQVISWLMSLARKISNSTTLPSQDDRQSNETPLRPSHPGTQSQSRVRLRDAEVK